MHNEDDDSLTGMPAQRRDVLRGALAGLGGLAASGLFPDVGSEAMATPGDPNAGPVVTPDPIPAAIPKSEITVELVDFCTPPRSAAKAPFAHLNFLYHAGDSSGFVYVAEGRGKIWRISPLGETYLFLDVAAVRGKDFRFVLSSNRSTTGLRSFAFHPDFEVAGKPGYRKVYTATTETPTSYSTKSKVPLFKDSKYKDFLHCVVAEWTLSAKEPRVDPASRREILRTSVYKDDHNLDQLMFDPNILPGQPGYGMMFMGQGDGGNVVKKPDPYSQAQNLGRALGKILRIDPVKPAGGKPYSIPADNPFFGKKGALPEIWAYGLRHPLNLSFDPGGTGAMLIADIGQENIEEINLGVKGGNYGWPLREGTFVTERADGKVLYAPPPGDAKFLAPVAQFDHTDAGVRRENVAITGGFVYRGTRAPALLGHYLFSDFVSGRVFHVPVAELKQGSQAPLKELNFKHKGQPTTLLALAGGITRADVRFGQDQAGEVYIMTKQDGVIRKLSPG